MSEKESSVLLQEVLDQTDIESTPEVEDEEELVRELLREVGMVKNGLCHLKDFTVSILHKMSLQKCSAAMSIRKKN